MPGSRVDLLYTSKDGDNTMSRAVVSNLQVLTAGTRYDIEKGKDGQAMPSNVVTLLVTPVVYSYFDDLRGFGRFMQWRRPAPLMSEDAA